MRKFFFLASAILMAGATQAQTASWTEQNANFTVDSRGIKNLSVVNAKTVWASSYDGSGNGGSSVDFTRTTDGLTWTSGIVSPADTLDWSMIYGISADSAWGVFYNPNGAQTGGGIFATTDGGNTWGQQVAYDANSFPNIVHFFDGLNGVTMGDPNPNYFEIYTTNTAGIIWTRVPQANIPAPLSGEFGLTSSVGAVGDTLWFGTNKNRVYRSIDKGQNWTVAAISGIGTGKYISSFDFKNNLEGVAIFTQQNSGNGVVKTVDGGATWTTMVAQGGATGMLTNRNAIVYVPGTNYMMAAGAAQGSSGTVLYDGTSWTTIDSVQHLELAMIDAQTGYSGGFWSSTTNTGMFKWSGDLSTANAIPFASSVKGYPNPADNYYTFFAGMTKRASVNLVLSDMNGRVVSEYNAPSVSGEFFHTFDLSTLSQGVYVLSANIGGNITTQKVVKK